MSYTIFANDAAKTTAFSKARGSYQYGLLAGYEAWSGATLTGKAKQYGGKYAQSRGALLARIEAAGLPVKFETISRKKVAVIG